jgi:hypothetical protein
VALPAPVPKCVYKIMGIKIPIDVMREFLASHFH